MVFNHSFLSSDTGKTLCIGGSFICEIHCFLSLLRASSNHLPAKLLRCGMESKEHREMDKKKQKMPKNGTVYRFRFLTPAKNLQWDRCVKHPPSALLQFGARCLNLLHVEGSLVQRLCPESMQLHRRRGPLLKECCASSHDWTSKTWLVLKHPKTISSLRLKVISQRSTPTLKGWDLLNKRCPKNSHCSDSLCNPRTPC